MTSIIDPYVGVCGVQTVDQARELERHWARLASKTDRNLMIGVLAIAPIVRGDGEPFWSVRCPEDQARSDIFSSLETSTGCLHFLGTKSGLAGELHAVLTVTPGIAAVQLNMAEVEPSEVVAVRRTWPQLALGWQVADPSLVSYRHALVEHLDFILLDTSRGRGIQFDPQSLVPEVQACREQFPQLLIGVAGGLDGGSVASLKALLSAEPRLSWDAEGRLRTAEQLDPRRANAYLDASASLLRRGAPTVDNDL